MYLCSTSLSGGSESVIKANILVIGIVGLLIILFFINAPSSEGQEFCFNSSNEFYKEYYMSKDGRIIDCTRKCITTSEGQSYMLLRSCLTGDKKTFDLVYEWSKNNIQRGDGLFSWLWGEHPDGEWKTLDHNTASDADVDIAFSLILAYEKWGDIVYLENAKRIINSIWMNETKEVNGYLVLMPGVVQTCCDEIEINPSYFSPYAFKLFQKYDKTHNWNRLVDSSYYYLTEVSSFAPSNLPPDWFYIKNDKIVFKEGKSDFSYDAIRVFPRVFLDYKITKDERALPILEKSKFFITEWKSKNEIYTNYKPTGQLKDEDKFIGSIALLVPIINMYDEKTAEQIYNKKLRPYFKLRGYWDSKKDYYGQNLLWFGCYFYKFF